MLVRAAWALLAFVHLAPAAVAFFSGLIAPLYGVEAEGDVEVLLAHRGALFLAVSVACTSAVFDKQARRALSLVVAISVIGFLILYARAGAPVGPLRSIAIVDAVAVIPLLYVVCAAWRSRSATR